MRTSRIAFRLLGTLCLTAVLGGCSDSGDSEPAPSERFAIVATPPLADTISARPVQALVVVVRTESGSPAADAIVQFSVVREDGIPNMLLRPLTGSDAVYDLQLPTDSRGQAAVQVQYGQVAGPGHILIEVPELGITQTLEFTIQVGNAATVVTTPRDTTVELGGTAQIIASASDRFSNLRPDPVVFHLESDPAGAATLDANGVLMTIAPGRLRVIAASGTVRDSVFVSVTPRGSYVSLTIDGLVFRKFDGTSRRILRGAGSVNSELEPAWTQNGDEVVVAPTLSSRRIDFLSLAGENSMVSWSSPAADAYWPAMSADGQYVYYSAVSASGILGVSRIKRDGSSPPEEILSCECRYPTLSPTGRFVAYHTEGSNLSDFAIRLFDTQLGLHVGLPLPGLYPEWSPDGSVIAAYEIATQRIRLFEPGGTWSDYVTPPDRPYYPGQISWSSDGRWIIARRSSGLDLIEVATGIVLPLWNTLDAKNAALRP